MTGLVKIELSDSVREQDLESLIGNFIRDGVLKEDEIDGIKRKTRSLLSQKPAEVNALGEIETFLKETRSIHMKLIPGKAYELDKMNYHWNLTKFTRDDIELKVEFENPGIISNPVGDTLYVHFNNTGSFLVPQNEKLLSLKEGYKIKVTVPP